MDNVCHTLLGAAIGQAGLKQRTRYGQVALTVAANVPDLDVLVFLTATPSVSFRRGWTHGVAAQLLFPVILVGVFILIDRYRRGRGRAISRHDPPLRPGWLLVLSYIGVYSHVLLDFLNNYGVRVLTPFDWRWFYGDAAFIIDPWLWLALGLGVWFSRRSRATAPARGALLFTACYIVVMLGSARLARGMVAEAWREARGAPAAALMVGPLPITPFTREVIVDAGDHYETGTFSWWSRDAAFDGSLIAKNDRRAEVAIAREKSPDIQAFLVWSRFPYWTLAVTPAGTRVTVGDVRFQGRGLFGASTIVGPAPEPP